VAHEHRLLFRLVAVGHGGHVWDHHRDGQMKTIDEWFVVVAVLSIWALWAVTLINLTG
jgi:hypothetical protein